MGTRTRPEEDTRRFFRFTDRELRLIYCSLMGEYSDKMLAQGMADEIMLEANQRGDDRAKRILASPVQE